MEAGFNGDAGNVLYFYEIKQRILRLYLDG